MAEIPVFHGGDNDSRRDAYRVDMHRLAVLNGPGKMVDALRATRAVLGDLKPFQPPDICGLRDRLEEMEFKSGEPNGVIFEAVDTLTGAYSLDRRRCDQILSEWEVKP